jgi:hypothetical protein
MLPILIEGAIKAFGLAINQCYFWNGWEKSSSRD